MPNLFGRRGQFSDRARVNTDGDQGGPRTAPSHSPNRRNGLVPPVIHENGPRQSFLIEEKMSGW